MKVSIIGYGRSGKACAKLLLKMGAQVFVSEKAPAFASSLIPHPSSLSFEFGGHTERVLDADMIVVSPGVSLHEPIILEAKKRGVSVIGELELASRFINPVGDESPGGVKGKIIGITGTNGKTTTAFLINNILKIAKKDSVICGNMGIPVSQVVNSQLRTQNSELFIIEVSSFQLESIESFRPKIGVLLNITQDHMDRHKDFEEYRSLKYRLFSNQTEQDYAVLNLDDPNVRYIKLRSKKLFFSQRSPLSSPISLLSSYILWRGEKLFSIKDLNLKWECLLPDYLASILVAKILEIKNEYILEGLKTFKGVPHRLEDIGVIRGVRFINNSMCTNPSAFLAVLKSLSHPSSLIPPKRACHPSSLVLIVGGKDKGIPLESIAQGINKYAKYVVLIGEVKEKLGKLVNIEHTYADSMESAVRTCFSKAKQLGTRNSQLTTVLLSPGFASFDWFTDFRERGDVFKKMVKRLAPEIME